MEGYFTTSGNTPNPKKPAMPSSSQIDEAKAILDELRAALEKQQTEVAERIAKTDHKDVAEKAADDKVNAVEEAKVDKVDVAADTAEKAEAQIEAERDVAAQVTETKTSVEPELDEVFAKANETDKVETSKEAKLGLVDVVGRKDGDEVLELDVVDEHDKVVAKIEEDTTAVVDDKVEEVIPTPPAPDSTEGVTIPTPPAPATAAAVTAAGVTAAGTTAATTARTTTASATAATAADTTAAGAVPTEMAVPATEAPIDAYLNQTNTDDAGTINAYTAIQEQRKKKRRGRIVRGIVAAGVATALLGGGVWWAQQQKQAAEVAPVVETDVISHGDFATVVSASGTTRPLSSSEVTPEVDGIITDVNVAEGDYVQQGDILFVMKNETLDKTLNDAKSGVEAAQKQVDRAAQALENATNNYNRIMQTQYASQEEADAAGEAATQAYDQAKEDSETANKTLTQAKATLKEAEDLSNKRVVTAPCDGTIITLNAKNGAAVGGATGGTGEHVASGSLATIGDLSQIRVSVQVNEVDISEVAVGQDAKVTFSALNDLELPATVEHIAAVSGSSNSQQETAGSGIVTYDVDLLIANPDPRVKPGMTARVEIITQSLSDVMMVPTAALIDNGDGTWAITVVDEAKNTTINRPVEVLAKNASTAAISGNVTQGDVVQIVQDSADEESMSSEV